MWIKNPDGTGLVPTQTLSGGGAMVEPIVVGQTGVCHVFVNPQADATGSVTVRAYTVPSDIVHDVAVDGKPDTVPFTIPGQNAKIRFTGSAGQDVSFDIASSVADTDFQLLKPNGSELTSGSFDSSGDFLDPISLPTDGTYKLVLDPQSFFLGNVTATLYNVPADATVAGAIGSTTVNTVSIPGQNAAMSLRQTDSGKPDRVDVTIPNGGVWIGRPKSAHAQFTAHSELHSRWAPAERDVHGTHRPAGIRHRRGHLTRSGAGAGRSPATDRQRRPWCQRGNGGAGQDALFTFTGSAKSTWSRLDDGMRPTSPAEAGRLDAACPQLNSGGGCGATRRRCP